MRPLKLLPLLFLLLCTPQAHSAGRPRPDSGCGVLTLQTAPGERLVLYREPGVARLAELDSSRLPRLAGTPEAPLFAVSGRSGGWSRVPYDDAGREGWLGQRRRSQYRPWQEFLPGRAVGMLPGLKKRLYALHDTPDEAAPERGETPRNRSLRIVKVRGDWALAGSPAGWFRWRDGDGRLTISLAD
jgi:hypothetical protein